MSGQKIEQERKKRKKISFDYDNSEQWDEIYLRVSFLGETVLVMIRRGRLSRQRSLSLKINPR